MTDQPDTYVDYITYYLRVRQTLSRPDNATQAIDRSTIVEHGWHNV